MAAGFVAEVNMSWFIMVFLGIYGAMHALFLWGMAPLLSRRPGTAWLLRGWMLPMLVAPIAVRMLDRAGYFDMARILAWIAYSWMGLLFIACCLLLPLLCWRLPGMTLSRTRRTSRHKIPRSPTSAAIILLATLGAGMYGFYEAAGLRVEPVTLVSDKLPPGTPPVRLAQISDLHLGLMHREKALSPIIARLHELKPDLLVVTGDMVDAQMDHLDGLSDLWRTIDPPLGKFAVTGNHEVYAGLQQSLDFLQRSGFTLLRNRFVLIGNRLLLAGEDDPAVGSAAARLRIPESAVKQRFGILLKHRPVVSAATADLFDLQLSGHAHRGQIFPFNYLTGLVYPMQSGLHHLAGGGLLYTSRGTGSWGPPMRIGAPPEITLIEIVPAARP
jgi:predicted MPP superfamily phosphohydrolase